MVLLSRIETQFLRVKDWDEIFLVWTWSYFTSLCSGFWLQSSRIVPKTSWNVGEIEVRSHNQNKSPFLWPYPGILSVGHDSVHKAFLVSKIKTRKWLKIERNFVWFVLSCEVLQCFGRLRLFSIGFWAENTVVYTRCKGRLPSSPALDHSRGEYKAGADGRRQFCSDFKSGLIRTNSGRTPPRLFQKLNMLNYKVRSPKTKYLH